jgi:hypothetical protein
MRQLGTAAAAALRLLAPAVPPRDLIALIWQEMAIVPVAVGAISNTSYLAAVLVAPADLPLPPELLSPQGPGGHLAQLQHLLWLALLLQRC